MKKSIHLVTMLMGLCLLVPALTFAQTAPDDDECRDAAGGIIECPTEEPTEEPTEAPTALPEPTAAPPSVPPADPVQPEPEPEQPADPGEPVEPESEQPDDSTAVNPLRPSATGACLLATFGTVRINVRQSPSFDAPIIGMLDPDTLYAVDSVVVTGGEIWLGVMGGWVHSSTVVYDGDCPVRQVQVVRADYRVMIEPLPEPSDEGSLYPDEQCIELLDGTILCYQVLLAIPNDGTDSIALPSLCWFTWPGGNFCITNTMPGGDWDPQPPNFPYPSDPPPPPPPAPDDGDDEGIPYCYDQNFLRAFISPDDEDGSSVLEGNMVSLGFLKAPGFQPDPQPCRIDAPIIRFDEPAADGSFPLDIIEAIIQWPPPTLDDETNPFLPLIHITPDEVIYLDTIRVDDGGDFCAPTAPHGFENCPNDDGSADL